MSGSSSVALVPWLTTGRPELGSSWVFRRLDVFSEVSWVTNASTSNTSFSLGRERGGEGSKIEQDINLSSPVPVY